MYKKIFNKLLEKTNNISLKKKLLCTYFLLIMIPLFLFTSIYYTRTSTIIKEQTLDATQAILDSLLNTLNTMTSNSENIIDIISHQELNHHQKLM